jgi:FkbH-like protein
MTDFTTIKKNLKKDYSSFKGVKLALLGDSATQLFRIALRGCAFEDKIDLDIFEADYDQIERMIFDTASELYAFNPDFVVIFQSTRKLKHRFYKLEKGGADHFAEIHLDFVQEAFTTLNAHLRSKIIYLNFNELDDREFGNYANKIAISFLYQLRKINFELMTFAQRHPGFFICDLSYLVTQTGSQNATDEKFYVDVDLHFTPDFFVVVAGNILDIVNAAIGRMTKCVVLDLDNTVWGGIIGDDGMERIQIGDYQLGKAFLQLQNLAKQLKERGIILAVCSKNTDSIAREPFEKHPQMVLRLDDIAVFVANWENKVDNIKYIREVLDIGFDSMVFLDDNPFERDMVRTHIPEITVPELPADPALYLDFLRNENLFETVSFSEEDRTRTVLYQVEADRQKFKRTFTDEGSYLLGLEMECDVEPISSFTLPRVAQLTQRSNQFNLRTMRYSEDDLKKMIDSGRFFTLTFTLRDKFGDHGLISAIILEDKGDGALFIDTWIMSCRVLKRNVENFVLNEILELARENHFRSIIGEYIPTPKNGLVKSLLKDLGFVSRGSGWYLDTGLEISQAQYIKKTIYDNGRNN